MSFVVLISADAEWAITKRRVPGARVRSSPLGEHLTASVARREVVFFHGGWGRTSAAASTQYAIDQWKPDVLINLGTCGGFEGSIKRGDILLIERTVIYDIIEQMTDPVSAIQHYTTVMDLEWLKGSLPIPITRGLMVSGDRDIVGSDVPGLKAKYGAVAADWESGAIAWVARRNGTRLLILRGVTDLVGPEGGEAYGNYELFVQRTGEIMSRLLDALPALLEIVEGPSS